MDLAYEQRKRADKLKAEAAKSRETSPDADFYPISAEEAAAAKADLAACQTFKPGELVPLPLAFEIGHWVFREPSEEDGEALREALNEIPLPGSVIALPPAEPLLDRLSVADIRRLSDAFFDDCTDTEQDIRILDWLDDLIARAKSRETAAAEGGV